MSLSFLRASSVASAIAALVLAAPLHAASFSFVGTSSDGHPVSGSASFTPNPAADTIAVTLTNSTATTLDAGELFTGLDFTLGGLTPSLSSALGIQRTVDGGGAFSDTMSAVSLSWSSVSVGSGAYQLNFNPNAKDALLGPPSGGNYAGANSSIKGNAGHNPFAALTASFVLSVPGLEATTPIGVKTFRFGTTLDPATGTITPEPASLVLAAAAALAAARRRS